MEMDVRKLRVGDTVVFTDPTAGYDPDVAKVRDMGLKVGGIHIVSKVDLQNFSCRLKLVGRDEWVNSVHFEVSE